VLDVAGRLALGTGLLVGGSLLASKYLKNRSYNQPPSAEPSTEATQQTEALNFLENKSQKLQLDDEAAVPPSQPPAENPMGQAVTASMDVTPPTTSDRYGQDVVPNQTQTMQEVREVSPVKPTVVDFEEKPATQSHVIASSQTFSPGSELEQLSKSAVPHTPVRDRADDLIAEYAAGIASEERDQKRIDQSVAVYAAGVAGQGERLLKNVQKEGRAEGISPVGRAAVRAAETFRKTPQYSEMMKLAGASMEPEELIGALGQPAEVQVRPTPATRFSGIKSPQAESAITEMIRSGAEPSVAEVASPITAPAAVPTRRNAESEEDEALARKALGLMPRSQGASLIKAKQPEAIATSQSQDIVDTTAKLLRQAKAMRTSREEAGGMLSQDIPSGPIHNISVSPANEVSVTYKTKAGSKTYNFDADPKYVNELVDRIQRGSFVKGQDSAGGFINAGRSMGLLQ